MSIVRSKMKRGLLIAFTFLGSYATVIIILPYSYWKDYVTLPASRIITDVLIDLVFCAVILELSLFIDKTLNRKISWMVHPLKRLLIQTLFQILGVLFLIICLASLYLIFDALAQSPRIGLREGFYAIISIILWALTISALNTGDFLLKNWKTATIQAAEFEVKAARNKQLAAEIELQALKLQLDPHFVFNNLSVLSELILKDPELGHEYTENFAKVYRYLLTNSKKKLIALREELRFLDAYLFLIRNRMGGGCLFRINIDASKFDLLIPPVTLQLFIENAIKYNRTEEENPLVVDIYVDDNDDLVVSNTLLPLMKKPLSTGIGLKNIIDRYALLGDKMPVIEKNDHTFTIKVPLIKLKILILEDEKLNADRIQRLMAKIRPNAEIAGVLTSIKKTVNWLSENESPDLIIMDIQLADGVSFEIFNLTEVRCPVIFTTAYDEYAVKAFKYNSIDYLLKPVEKDELEAAITKFENTTQPQYPLIEALMAQMRPKEYRTRFLLPYRDGYRKIEVEDISFFYSNMNISYANLISGERVVVPQTMETLEQELEPKNFFRVNRQYILHVNSIEEVQNSFNGKLKLKVKNCTDNDILVSRTKASLLKNWLGY